MGGHTHPRFHPTLVSSILDDMLHAFDLVTQAEPSLSHYKTSNDVQKLTWIFRYCALCLWATISGKMRKIMQKNSSHLSTLVEGHFTPSKKHAIYSEQKDFCEVLMGFLKAKKIYHRCTRLIGSEMPLPLGLHFL